MIITIFVLRLILPPPGSQYTGKKAKTWCPLHKWIYKNEVMVCELCNKTPQDVVSSISNSNPY
jgi:hypothetical protein